MAENDKKSSKKVKSANDIVQSPGRLVLKRLRKNKLAMAGLFILLFMVIASVIGPLIVNYKLESIDLFHIEAGPSAKHILGTDEVGRDVLARVMYAGRVSLMVGVVAVVIEVLIGSILGAVAGYYGGIIDGIIMRIVDILMSIPSLPLLIIFGAILSDFKVDPSMRIYIVMFIIGGLGWTGLCRIVRGQILSLREQQFMQAADALGLKDSKKIFKHLLPNTFSSIIVAATLGIGDAILTESTLSYLGLGVTPPVPSWGQLVQVVNDLSVLQTEPWRWIPPGLCIFLTVIAINIFGDGLRDALDPKLKR
jgi:peptide/nickel transport system permease protein